MWGWCGWRAQRREGRVSTSVEKHRHVKLSADWLIPCSEFTREKGFGDEISFTNFVKNPPVNTAKEIVPGTGFGKRQGGWLCAQVWASP